MSQTRSSARCEAGRAACCRWWPFGFDKAVGQRWRDELRVVHEVKVLGAATSLELAAVLTADDRGCLFYSSLR